MDHCRPRSYRLWTCCLLSILVCINLGGCISSQAISVKPSTSQEIAQPLAQATPTPLMATPFPTERPATAALDTPALSSTATLEPSPTTQATVETTPTLTPPDTTEEMPACNSGRGQFETGQLMSSLLTSPLDFRVYLPPCFERVSDRRYPVLYLLHGLTFSDDQWVRLGIGDAADALIISGQIQPLIIVFPQDNDALQPTQSHFGLALVEELVPWIDTHYPTRVDRSSRAIGGLSRGASWAVHIGLTEWHLFGAIGAHSLALFWTDSAEINFLLGSPPWDAYPKIYMDIGTRDQDLRSASDFEARLMAYHIPHEWHLFPGFHDEAYWKSHLDDYLRWYSAQLK